MEITRIFFPEYVPGMVFERIQEIGRHYSVSSYDEGLNRHTRHQSQIVQPGNLLEACVGLPPKFSGRKNTSQQDIPKSGH